MTGKCADVEGESPFIFYLWALHHANKLRSVIRQGASVSRGRVGRGSRKDDGLDAICPCLHKHEYSSYKHRKALWELLPLEHSPLAQVFVPGDSAPPHMDKWLFALLVCLHILSLGLTISKRHRQAVVCLCFSYLFIPSQTLCYPSWW